MGRLVPPRADLLLALLFVGGSIAEALGGDTSRSAVVHTLLAVPAMTALAWRRRYPVTVAGAVMASNIAVNPQGDFSTLLALVLVCFTVGAECDPPRSWFGLALVVVLFLGALVHEGLTPSDVAAAAVFLVGPWTVGLTTRERAARTGEAVDRAARLERDRDAETAAAAAQERVRIARELHDIVSHSISVVTIQTQAVRRRLRPDQVAEARDLASVEATARDAMAEMRRLFGVLRSDAEPATLAPQPGLAELERLLQQVREAGLPVDLQVVGERVELPPGVDLAAYRIVQEGLTNALKHASAGAASVILTYLPSRLHITVRDDGRGPAEQGEGHGLLGMRERVALYGGDVEFGAASGGGCQLTASLPVPPPC